MLKSIKIINFLFGFLFIIVLFISDSNIGFSDDEIIDLESRKEELTKDAYAGDPEAQYMLGRIALETKNPPDHSTAVYWFRIASESNHIKYIESHGKNQMLNIFLNAVKSRYDLELSSI